MNLGGDAGYGGGSKCGGRAARELLRVPGAAGQRRPARARRRRREPREQPRLRLRRERDGADVPRCARARSLGRGGRARSACCASPTRASRSSASRLTRGARRSATLPRWVARARGGAARERRRRVRPRGRGGRGADPRPYGTRSFRGEPRRAPAFAHAVVDAGADRARLRATRGPRHRAVSRPPDRVLARQPRRLPQLRHRPGDEVLSGLLRVRVGPDGTFMSGSFDAARSERDRDPSPPTRPVPPPASSRRSAGRTSAPTPSPSVPAAASSRTPGSVRAGPLARGRR